MHVFKTPSHHFYCGFLLLTLLPLLLPFPLNGIDFQKCPKGVIYTPVDLARLRQKAKEYKNKHTQGYYAMPFENPFSKNFQCIPLESYGLIVGGKQVPKFSRPWLVFLQSFTTDYSQYCAAVLISNQWILTAGHCIAKDGKILSKFHAYLGMHDRRKWKEEQAIQITISSENAFVPSNYNSVTFENDIALIKLPHKLISHAHIKPICLPPVDFEPTIGTICEAAGWGAVESVTFKGSSNLRKIDVMIRECVSDSKNLLCAGALPNAAIQTDSCVGDSGGPLVCQINGIATTLGVLSTGYKSCDSRKAWAAARYQPVTKHMDWIKDILRKHGNMDIP